jgi:hypothetical protein
VLVSNVAIQKEKEVPTVSEPVAYRVAADHITISSSSADKVRPSKRFEVKDVRAMPAACETFNTRLKNYGCLVPSDP